MGENLIDLKILAMTESLLVWDRMAETGEGKAEAIDWLFERGMISRDLYMHCCPLCEYLKRLFSTRVSQPCYHCPWPGNLYHPHRVKCLQYGSPYLEYSNYMSKKNAIKVLKFLSELEF